MQYLIAPGTVPLAQADVTPPAGTPGFATNGNPVAGIPATRNYAWFMNMLASELGKLVLDAGGTLDALNWSQVSWAVQEFVANEAARAAAVESNLQSSKAPLVAPQFSVDGTDVPTTPTPDGSNPLQIANIGSVLGALLNGKGLSNSLGANGYQILPGGLIVQWGKAASGANGNSSVDFPIPYPHACFGVWPVESNAGGAWPNQNVTLHGVSNAPPANQFVMYSMQFNNPSTGIWTGVAGLGYYWISLGY
ncbi:gp53-like domain-containing protein [Gluconacetobacter sp.]|uniref:gp53-like domain-containing protein n=1 Tax=Gluconacetobacter sp. TaxID=1935994 RepID=UPI0039EC7905